MLTADDKPTIRHAIYKRIDKEPGVRSSEVTITLLNEAREEVTDAAKAACIHVRVWVDLEHPIYTRAAFELPPQFDIAHLHNEIDQIAEQLKAARRDHFGRTMRGQILGHAVHKQLAGTGLRGLWPA